MPLPIIFTQGKNLSWARVANAAEHVYSTTESDYDDQPPP